MNIDKFIQLRPFLYHLTCRENAEKIVAGQILFSANELIRMSGERANRRISRIRRTASTPLVIGHDTYFLRDQLPISEINLAKCLTDSWGVGDFINHLNDRVFMWPTIGRLMSHYLTYESEKPVIFRFSTAEMLASNPHVKFCRLNSGATRSNSYLGGAPPDRGSKTFLSAVEFDLSPSRVVEVTFEKQCSIVGTLARGTHPERQFRAVPV